MNTPLSAQIKAYARPGEPIQAKALLHLANRAAVDQALARLRHRGVLLRIARGVYVRPLTSRFGTYAPPAAELVRRLAAQQKEIVVQHGAAAANAFGLTTQVPMREIYLTSGPTRQLNLGAGVVELRHTSSKLLTAASGNAGSAIQALNWAGKSNAPAAWETVKSKLSNAEVAEIEKARPLLPGWLASTVSASLGSAA